MLCNYDIQARGEGEGFIPVGVDTLGPVCVRVPDGDHS